LPLSAECAGWGDHFVYPFGERKAPRPLAIRTILGACVLLSRIPIANWLTALLEIAWLAVLFRWKVNVPLLMPRRQRWVSSPTQCCNFEPRAMTGYVLCAMCRFSDAGMTGSSTRHHGRRPKSAKARNRGRGTDEAVPRAQLWGFRRVRAAAGSAARWGEWWRWSLQVGGEVYF
jgi:hypothetical protein